MSNIKIEDNVPVPKVTACNRLYPFAEMKVGQSFEIEYNRSVRSAAYQYGWRHNCKFSTRMIPETHRIRIWRIA